MEDSYLSKGIVNNDVVVKEEQFSFNEETFDIEFVQLKVELEETENDLPDPEISSFPNGSNREENCARSISKTVAVSKRRHRLRGVKPILCVMCNTGFPNADLYEQHVNSAHKSDRPFQCQFCKKRFKDSIQRKRHETIHDNTRFEGPPQYKCDLCEKEYHLKLSLDTHKRKTHFGYKPPRKPESAPVTQHHSRTGTKNKPRQVARKEVSPCTKCGRQFTTSWGLKKHMISHTDARTFQCQYCETAFKFKYDLLRHVSRFHELGIQTLPARPRYKAGEPCVCTKCGKSFPHPGRLATHMQLHTGERPHTCKVCGKSFRLQQGLKTHEMSHAPPDDSGLRTFSCRICGKSGFKVFTGLASHISGIHGFDMSGDSEVLKPYSCGICGKPYYLAIKAVICALLLHDPTSLRQQMFKYKCPECPDEFGFYSISKWRSHWELVHPEQEPPSELKHYSAYCTKSANDLPRVILNKKRAFELTHGSGVPLEVENSCVTLYTKLELVQNLHSKKTPVNTLQKQCSKTRSNHDKLTYRKNNLSVSVISGVNIHDSNGINKMLNNRYVTVVLHRLHVFSQSS